ncbi:hypothetical protein JL720_13667 [Aureococcus anophagefferens]|nr:hypothetical protein JL720_13667 [Aureococcus anophagefferens]
MDPLAVPAQPDDESRVRRRSRTSRTFDDDAEVQAARAAVVAEAEACLVGDASDAGAPAAAPSAAPDVAVAEGPPPASPALPFDHDDPSSPSRRRKSRNSGLRTMAAPSDRNLPRKEADLFKSIVKFYETKQYKKGLKASDAVLRKFPNHGETLAMRGLVLNCLERKEEAYDYVKKGLKADMRSHVCWHVYGLLYRSDRQYPQAIKSYKQALKIDPDNVQILRDLSLLQVIDAYGETIKNEQRREETAERSYEDSELALYRNSILEEEGRYGEALAHLAASEAVIVDKYTLAKKRAELLLLSGPQARDGAGALDRDAATPMRVVGLDASTCATLLKLAATATPTDKVELTDAQVADLDAAYALLAAENPKSEAYKSARLKRGGAVRAAAAEMVAAREMDLADRYINNKATKYLLRAGDVAEARKTAAMFTRPEAGDAEQHLNDMQASWYELEVGLALGRDARKTFAASAPAGDVRAKAGLALKLLLAVEKHFADFIEDQFDFHTYCVRKMTLRAYVSVLRFEDGIRGHKFFRRAAKAAGDLYAPRRR